MVQTILAPAAAAVAVVVFVEMRMEIARKRRDLLSQRITALRADFDARAKLVDLRLDGLEKRETARILAKLP